MLRRHRADVLLLLAVLAAGVILVLVLLGSSGGGARVEVRVAGEVKASYPLNRDGTYEIQGVNGGTNLLVISNGTASVTQASCPDKLCVHMGAISRTGQSIVCLPNQVVVEITGEGSDLEPDLTAG